MKKLSKAQVINIKAPSLLSYIVRDGEGRETAPLGNPRAQALCRKINNGSHVIVLSGLVVSVKSSIEIVEPEEDPASPTRQILNHQTGAITNECFNIYWAAHWAAMVRSGSLVISAEGHLLHPEEG